MNSGQTKFIYVTEWTMAININCTWIFANYIFILGKTWVVCFKWHSSTNIWNIDLKLKIVSFWTRNAVLQCYKVFLTFILWLWSQSLCYKHIKHHLQHHYFFVHIHAYYIKVIFWQLFIQYDGKGLLILSVHGCTHNFYISMHMHILLGKFLSCTVSKLEYCPDIEGLSIPQTH